MKHEDLEKMSFDDQCAYWKGRILVGIGKGKFDDEIFFMIDYLTRTAYKRGRLSLKTKEQK